MYHTIGKRICCLLMAVLMLCGTAFADVATTTDLEEPEQPAIVDGTETETPAAADNEEPAPAQPEEEPAQPEETESAVTDEAPANLLSDCTHYVYCDDLTYCVWCGETIEAGTAGEVEHCNYDNKRYDDDYHVYSCACGEDILWYS